MEVKIVGMKEGGETVCVKEGGEGTVGINEGGGNRWYKKDWKS